MSDDSPQEMLGRLKQASEALDAAQDASEITTQEIARAQHAVGTATSVINGIHKPKRKATRPASNRQPTGCCCPRRLNLPPP